MVVMLCNCPPDEASSIAHALVAERLVACVNLLPGVRSIYAWDGAIQDDGETTLLIKTSDARVADASDRIRALHSYDTPEILVLDVDADRSDPRYVAWVRATTGG